MAPASTLLQQCRAELALGPGPFLVTFSDNYSCEVLQLGDNVVITTTTNFSKNIFNVIFMHKCGTYQIKERQLITGTHSTQVFQQTATV